MALIAHWPLNGDILDYSGNGFHLTNNGATISNEGKIGKCYEINGRNKYLTVPLSFNNILDTKNFSISFWIKNINETNTTEIASIGLFGTLSSPRNFNFYAFNKSTDFHWSCNGLGNGIITNILELNVWKFITVSIKENNIKIFINNQLKINNNNTNNLIINNELNFQIGTNDNVNSSLKYLINDFKIFNHELSKKEIKELYQTKILDFKFNECEEPTINLLEINKQTKFNEVNTHLTSDNKLKFESVIEQGSLYNKVLKLTVLEDLGEIDSYPSLPTGVINGFTGSRKIDLISGKKYTLTYRYKTKNYQKGSIAIWSHSRRLDGSTAYTDIAGLPDTKGEWKIFKYNFTCPNDINARHFNVAGIRKNNQGFEYYVDWMQLEEKEYDTEYIIKERKGKVIDSSGYKNHGLIELNSSPKWLNTNEYEFDGVNDFILIKNPKLKLIDEFTFSCFVYSENWHGTRNERIVSCTESAGWNIEINVQSGKISFPVRRSGNYSSAVLNLSELPKTGWIHICVTTNKINNKIFINGIQKASSNNLGGNIEYINNSIFIGAEAQTSEINPVGGHFKGKIKNMKFFANALSEQDIKELYENSMTIDKNNNVICNEIIENKNLINLKLFYLSDLTINGGTYLKNYNLNTYKIINPSIKNTFRLNFNYDFIKNFENKEFIFSFKYKLINGSDEFFTPTDINDGNFLFKKKIGNQFILKCIRTSYTEVYKFIDFILDENTEIELYDFQMYLFSDYVTDKLNDKHCNIYKEINEIDYIDTTKINKNNELICNTISEV